MSSKKEMEIRKMEQAGMSVVSIGRNGKLEYATDRNEGDEYCDSCEFLRFEPDPDPTDWFNATDEKAICTKLDVAVARSLSPREMTDIPKPLYCPMLGRELTEGEQKEAALRLSVAKDYR